MTSNATRAETEITVVVRSGDDSRRELRDVARRLDGGHDVDLPARLLFQSMEQLLAALTPNRWVLIQTLHRSGPTSIRALARLLARDYRGVHGDVTKLLELGLVARNDEKLVYVPWEKITAEISTTEQAA